MKQILLYTCAVLVLAGAVVAYRYAQQPGQIAAHAAPPASVVQPVKTGPAPQPQPVVTSPEAVTGTLSPAATAADDGVETDKVQAETGGAASTEAVIQNEAPASTTVQAGTVQYNAPPNPGAATLGEFAQHFRKRLNSMPPEERDAAELSRRMQGEYNNSRSSLAEAIKKSREGK